MSTEMIAQKRPVELEASWLGLLRDEFDSHYMRQLRAFLMEEKQSGWQVFPSGRDMFNALNSTAFDDVKVVILGQDPYHGEGQAHGLCFSVKPGVAVPPSLRNIYRELETDVGFVPPGHGFLQAWAQQGVLLLNSILTVRANQAGSHHGKGWERFTDRIVELLSQNKESLVFLLWGSYAQKKGAMVDRSRHLVLQSVHPSPLSASRGFFGNRHFSQANTYLKSHGKPTVNWQIPPRIHSGKCYD